MLKFNGHGYVLEILLNGSYRIGSVGNDGQPSIWITIFETENKPERDKNIILSGYVTSRLREESDVRVYSTAFHVTDWKEVS